MENISITIKEMFGFWRDGMRIHGCSAINVIGRLTIHSTEMMAIQRGVRMKYSIFISSRAVSVEAQKEREGRTRMIPSNRDLNHASCPPCHSMLGTIRAFLTSASPPATLVGHDDVKVHTEDTNRGVVSCTKVNMLLIPNPKLPVSEKLRRRSSYSFTLRPRSRISSAFAHEW